jgi:hypothetical protein
MERSFGASLGEVEAPRGMRADGEELRVAIVARDAKQIMAILARNANSASMAALCQIAGPGIANRLELILKGNEWARARAYLGEQVAFDRQLATHDKDAIFRDLQQLSDRRALDLLSGAAGGDSSRWRSVPRREQPRAR